MKIYLIVFNKIENNTLTLFSVELHSKGDIINLAELVTEKLDGLKYEVLSITLISILK